MSQAKPTAALEGLPLLPLAPRGDGSTSASQARSVVTLLRVVLTSPHPEVQADAARRAADRFRSLAEAALDTSESGTAAREVLRQIVTKLSFDSAEAIDQSITQDEPGSREGQDVQDSTKGNEENSAKTISEIVEEYRRAANEIDAVIEDQRQELAEKLVQRFSPAFNALVKTLQLQSYEDKQTAVKLINSELRSRNLGVRCPKTGHPSFLIVDTGDDPTVGRFQFAHAAQGSTVRTTSRNVLPVLEVTPGDIPLRTEEEQQKVWAVVEQAKRAERTRKGRQRP